MNFSDLNLDLQGFAKRVYDNLLYKSTFMNFLNKNYIGELRNTGTPVIEVSKEKLVALNTHTAEITTALTPGLATYDSVKVDLTELRKSYSVNISPLVANVAQAISGQVDLEDSAISKAIDTYGFNKLGTNEDIETFVWNFSTNEEYIGGLNNLKMKLFNNDVYEGYKLGLEATEYGKLVSALTSVLKYETMAGVEGVDRGIVANAYGIEIFPVNSSVLTNDELGYFASEIGVVGDAFFSKFNQWNGDRPGYPGMISIEGIVMFGAEVVKHEAIIKLVAQASV